MGTLCLLGFVGAVAFMDLRTRRIPNALTVAAAAVALGLAVTQAGWHGALATAAGLVTGLMIFLPLCLAGKIGAGDVKAMGAVGAFLGPAGVLLAAICTLLAGGITAAFAVLSFRRSAGSRRDSGVRQHQLPYGIAIAFGTLAAVVLR